MKRLLLALLFGASFALHDFSHAHLAPPQHEVCAVTISPAVFPKALPRVVTLRWERIEILPASVHFDGRLVQAPASARAPPAVLLPA